MSTERSADSTTESTPTTTTTPTASQTPKPKRTRICGRQSKNGCLTCKTRRIKCDEEKPSCLRCARSGWVCQGYPDRMIGDTYIVMPVAKTNKRGAHLSKQQMNPSPSWALTVGYVQTGRQHHLARCGLSLLSSDTLSFAGGTVLETLLAQLCVTIPSITVAAIALGAVHQWQELSCNSDVSTEDGVFAAFQYRMALREMQQHLLTQPDGPIPLIMICFILSLVEILWQQEANALFHLRAASKLLQDRRDGQRSSLSRTSAQRKTFDTELESLEDSIEFILRSVDFHICSYALSKPPDIATIPIPLVLPLADAEDLKTAQVTLTQLVHACYAFTRDAYTFKYLPQSASPAIYLEQGRYIAQLSTWLGHFNSQILPAIRVPCNSADNGSTVARSQDYAHAFTLRMTALSILIHLSCILTPYETAFAAHALHFQQIVIDGENVLSLRNQQQQRHSGTGNSTSNSNLRPGPGIIQPLFLTAFKYRHPVWRRRAIACLAIAGREGPWWGRREARVTGRLLMLEEGMWLSSSTFEEANGHASCFSVPVRGGEKESAGCMSEEEEQQQQQHTTQQQRQIPIHSLSDDGTVPPPSPLLLSPDQQYPPEHALINNMGMDSPSPLTTSTPAATSSSPSSSSPQISTLTNASGVVAITVRFSKCMNMEAMLAYSCGHGRAGIGEAQGQYGRRGSLRGENGEAEIDIDGGLEAHLFGLCRENPFWRGWEERLEFWRG